MTALQDAVAEVLHVAWMEEGNLTTDDGAAAVMSMPEMDEVRAALRMCWETFDWFRYDWAQDHLSGTVMNWIAGTA